VKIAGKIARWKMDEASTGMMRMVEGERGHNLKIDGEEVGYVGAVYKNEYNHTGILGYGWMASSSAIGIPRKTTFRSSLVPSVEEAKEACVQYVRECLEKTSVEA
jgi:hypothetical protein